MSHLYSVPVDGGHIYVSDVKSPEWDEERVQVDIHNEEHGGSIAVELSFDEAYLLEMALNKIRTSSNEGIHGDGDEIPTT